MFSLKEKMQIAEKIEQLLLDLNHPEMHKEKVDFSLHVNGKEAWSWADIKPNWVFVEYKLDINYRILAYQLLELSFITRWKILSELNLISKEDDGINHVDLLERIFKAAQERKVLPQLWDKVELATSA